MMPIAGKTICALVPNNVDANVAVGSLCYGVIPVVLDGAGHVGRTKYRRNGTGDLSPAYALPSWTYFYLNYAFFGYPRPATVHRSVRA